MDEKRQLSPREIADTLIREGTRQTATGRWSVSVSEIKERFGLDLTADSDAGKLLAEALQQEEEVNELIMTEDNIEMAYHLEYCPACNQGGASGMMNLLSLMGCNLYDVHLCHQERPDTNSTIPRLDQDTLTGQGKADWQDVLEAKVCRISPCAYGLQVALAGCDPQRLADFSSLLSGCCAAEDFERWIKDPNRTYAMEGEQPEPCQYSGRTVNLIATYEELFQVPEAQRLACYFDAYGSHFFKAGVTEEKLRPVYEKALAVMEMTDAAYQEESNPYLYRGEVVSRMRDCLLAKELKAGEKVLFVNTEPYGGPGDFSFRGGIIQGIDPQEKTCTVQGQFFAMADVPLHYVLGRFNPDSKETHYGKEQVEVLFGCHEALANQYLLEAEEAWEARFREAETPEPVMQ